MSYNGSGVFIINTAGQPVTPGSTISSTAFNALTLDLANGLTTALTKDGQTTPTSNIPLGGFKITGLGAGTNPGDAVNFGQLSAGGYDLTVGNLGYTGTLTGGTGVVNLGTNQLYKDASGRIGVGVVPRTDWVAGATVLQFPNNHSIVQGNLPVLYTFSNLYLGTDGNYRFTGSSAGGYFYSGGGNFVFARSLYTPTPDALAVTSNMLSMSQSTGIVEIGYADIGTTTFGFSMYPKTDNYTSCGSASKRWTIVYATTGTINTSDARHKSPVRSLNELEIAAAQELASEIGAFQWLEAVEKKGDAARLHIGMTVQRVIEVMKKHSLDPFAYGLVCFDEWDDIVNEDGEKTQEKGDVYSLRPDQLSLFIAKGQQVSIQNLTNQLEEIKAQLAASKP